MPKQIIDIGDDDGAVFGKDAAAKIGFYGVAAPVAKQTITGTRDDGVALASLLTALAALGLIVDSTDAT